MKTYRNRWGSLISEGLAVRLVRSRAGWVDGKVQKIDATSATAKAYGIQVILDCGSSGTIDDCMPLEPTQLAALNEARDLIQKLKE